ncbi:hypothetical protein JW756_05335 [Candidatus Woesearchaeota archaeon]|nr:hypothetical protein [Candidatus Woesearchaeota archaeon]
MGYAARDNQAESYNGLEKILEVIEPENPELRQTVLATYKTASELKEKYFNQENSSHHGITFYINHDPLESKLKINGGNAEFLDDYNSVLHQEGKELIEKIFNDEERNDGAVEILANGLIPSIRRLFKGDPDETAAENGIVAKGHETSYKDWGFAVPVFSRHIYAIHASAKDHKIYVITLSEKGHLRMMHAGKISYSTISSEIHPTYRQYLASNKIDSNKRVSSVTGAEIPYHTVHEARERPIISAEEALRMQFAILHEQKLAHGHYY